MDTADSISEEKPHEKRKATSPEPMFCSYSAEGIKFLDIIQSKCFVMLNYYYYIYIIMFLATQGFQLYTHVDDIFCPSNATLFPSVHNITELGKLERVYRFVESCEVFVQERCVKLVGTPEGCQQAKKKFDDILVGWFNGLPSSPIRCTTTVRLYTILFYHQY